MTKDEIQKNSEHWYNKYKDAEKRIAELEAQIEKMKCCANCKKYWCMCEYGDREMQICDKWEIKEK